MSGVRCVTMKSAERESWARHRPDELSCYIPPLYYSVVSTVSAASRVVSPDKIGVSIARDVVYPFYHDVFRPAGQGESDDVVGLRRGFTVDPCIHNNKIVRFQGGVHGFRGYVVKIHPQQTRLANKQANGQSQAAA